MDWTKWMVRMYMTITFKIPLIPTSYHELLTELSVPTLVQDFVILPRPPKLEMSWDSKKKRCEKMRITFFIEEPSMSKFINVLFPMMLITILSGWNVVAACRPLGVYTWMSLPEDDDNSYAISITDYLEIASGIAIATILLMPQLIDRKIKKNWTLNHFYIILVSKSCGRSQTML